MSGRCQLVRSPAYRSVTGSHQVRSVADSLGYRVVWNAAVCAVDVGLALERQVHNFDYRNRQRSGLACWAELRRSVGLRLSSIGAAVPHDRHRLSRRRPLDPFGCQMGIDHGSHLWGWALWRHHHFQDVAAFQPPSSGQHHQRDTQGVGRRRHLTRVADHRIRSPLCSNARKLLQIGDTFAI
jgi:hypothetical protein